ADTIVFVESDHVHRDLHSFPTRRSSDLPNLKGSQVDKVRDLRWERVRCAEAFRVGRPATPAPTRHRRSDRSGRCWVANGPSAPRSEEHTSELQSLRHLVCRLLLEKK